MLTYVHTYMYTHKELIHCVTKHRLQQANVKTQQLEKTAREMGEKLQAVTLAKSVKYYMMMILYYMLYLYRSNVEADLTIEKQWRTSLQVCMYSKPRVYY